MVDRGGADGLLPAGGGKLAPLTSLRFAAALLVFAYHAPATQAFGRDYTLGQAGVGFFFVLSGFILTYTYSDALTGAVRDVRAFYVARVARVFPAYVVATLFALLVLARFGGPFWNPATPAVRTAALLAQLLAVQAWVPDERIYLGINSPAWSVSVEAFFYALFPLLILVLSRASARSSARAAFGAAGLAWTMVTAALLVPHPIAVWAAYVFPPVRLLEFVMGMLVAFAFLRGYRVPAPATLWEALALGGVVVAILVGPRVPVALRYAVWLVPFWAALIAVVAAGAGRVSRALSHPVLVRLGEISYAFYLLHVSMLTIAENVVARPFVSVVALAATLAGATALYAFVERPLRARIRALVPTRAAGPARSGATAASVQPARSSSAASVAASVGGDA